MREALPNMLSENSVFPEISILFDINKMQLLFQNELDTSRFLIVKFKIIRFRYKMDGRISVVYFLSYLNKDLNLTFDTFFLCKVKVGQLKNSSKKNKLLNSTSDFPDTIYIKDLNVNATSYLNDEKLSHLSDFRMPISERLRNLLCNSFDDFHLRTKDLYIRPIRYRPRLSATLCVENLSANTNEDEKCYVKVSSSELDNFANIIIKELTYSLNKKTFNISILQPSFSIDDGQITSYRSARGVCLSNLLNMNKDVGDLAGLIANALYSIHSINVCGSSDYFISKRIQNINRLIKVIYLACPELNEKIQSIEILSKKIIEPNCLRPIHFDLKPEHIFIFNEQIEFIDNETFCIGDPLIDLCALEARIGLLQTSTNEENLRITQFRESLHSAYFDLAPKQWRSSLASARAYASIFICAHVIQTLKPGWKAIVHREIDNLFLISRRE